MPSEDTPLVEIPKDLPVPANNEVIRFENVFGQFLTSSLVPSDVPRIAKDQIRVYKSGSDIRLYFYDTTNNAWNYIPFISVPASLSDPNADRIVFWDDSDGKITYLTLGTGLSISGTTITATGLSEVLFGNGADGNVTISGNTTLTSDKHYNNLTVNSNLDCGGFRIFVKGTLSGTGTIKSTGNNGGNGGNGVDGGSGGTGGTAGTAGSARTTGTLFGGNAGIAGSAGGTGSGGGVGGSGTNGTNGGAVTGTILGAGRAGVAGTTGGTGDTGGSSGGSGGTAGTAGANTNANTTPDNPFSAQRMADWVGGTYYQLKASSQNGGTGGSGGGGASGGGTARTGGGGGGSGGGGSDAGNLVIFAKTVDFTGGLTFNAVGGTGGNGGNGGNGQTGLGAQGGGGAGGSGGTGGNGGIIVLVYITATGSPAYSVSGGTGGSFGTAGTGGSNAQNGNAGLTGIAGNYYSIQIT